jgi:4-diphosphocytidyl-2-C-methyl-D-erythritol kinase
VSVVVERAHAKLNVCLRVLGRREDGYHDIESLILPLELHDTVIVEPAETFSVTVEGERAGELAAAGGESLVAKAAEIAARWADRGAASARVVIQKRIPVAAGLGGGSADAAAFLRAFVSLGVLSPSALADVAAEVGSDVPAMLGPDAVFVRGRGERVAPVHAQPTTWVVAPLPLRVRSEQAYGWWDDAPVTGPDPGASVGALETGRLERLGEALFNDLQFGVVKRHPQIAEAIEAFAVAGALGAIMTGSGPTVVALASDDDHAQSLASVVPGSFMTTGPPRTMSSRSGVV